MSNFSFGFKTTAAAPTGLGGGLSFGAATTTAPAQSIPFGTGFGTGVTSTAQTGFGSFGTTSTSMVQPGLGGFGTGFGTTATTTATSFGTGFFSSTTALKKQVTFTGLSSTTTTFSSTFTTPAFVGLGGFDLKKGQTSGLANNEVTRIGESKSVKDQVVLPEILATVEQFSTFVREERRVRDEITRVPSKCLFRVQKDCSILTQQLHEVKSLLQKNSCTIEKFKRDAIQDLKDSEIAQRTRDTPIGLQPENLQPIEYFQRLVDSFETQLGTYTHQILEAEQFFSSIRRTPTPAELSSLFEKLNEGFAALAAQLQVVNEALQRQKDTYLRYKQTCHHDHTDIFKQSVNQSQHFNPITTVGPTPFSLSSTWSSIP